MTDPYKEQYKKETKQIHAPAELIARTKAAVREEEARIRRESVAQTAGTKVKGVTAKGFRVRRWAYPLTAAAAILILVSVSLTMRGIKSEDMASDDTVYEESAMEAEPAEMSGGEDTDGGAAAGVAAEATAGAVASVEESVEAVEKAADEAASAEMDMAAASESVAEEEQSPELGAAADTADAGEAALAENTEEDLSEKAEAKEEERDGQQRKLKDAEAVKNTSGAVAENITIEKVVTKPEFCDGPDTETRVYKGETFQIAEEENGWAAYVETKDGSMYIIRGEAADMETFLEAGYRELMSD